MHPHRKKFALSHGKTITIYDTQTKRQTWSKTMPSEIESTIFSPHDTTLFLIRSHFPDHFSHTITKCNYVTDESKNYTLNYNVCLPIVTLHPVKQEMCIIHPIGVLFYHPDIVLSPGTKFIDVSRCINDSCQYSPDGSIVATGCQNRIYIINLDTIDTKPSHLQSEDTTDYHEYFNNLLFYANSVLTTVSGICIKNNGGWRQSNYTRIRYWDMKTLKPIHTSASLDSPKCHDLSLSPDREKLLVTLHDKCVILPVPFEVIYQPDTRKKAMLIYWLLANHELPNEIMLHLLEAFKR